MGVLFETDEYLEVSKHSSAGELDLAAAIRPRREGAADYNPVHAAPDAAAVAADSRVRDGPIYQPSPRPAPVVEGVFGERRDVPQGDLSAEQVRREAEAASGDQPGGPRYGAPFNRWEKSLPRPSVLSATGMHSRRFGDFMLDAQGLLSTDGAVGLLYTVMDLLDRPEPSVRQEIFSAPFKDWAMSDRPLRLVDAVLHAFGADLDGHMVRNDEDMHGSRMWLGVSGSRWFLLVERSKFAQGLYGQAVVMRVLEAFKFTEVEEAEVLLDEFSLPEEIHAELVARRAGATPEELAILARTLNRSNVQGDYDIIKAHMRLRYPPRPRAHRRAAAYVRALAGKLLQPPSWF